MSKGLKVGPTFPTNEDSVPLSQISCVLLSACASPGQAPKSQGEAEGETLGRNQAVEKKRKAEVESGKLNKT